MARPNAEGTPGGVWLFDRLLDDGAGVGACAACKPVRRELVELARTSHQDGAVPVIKFVVAHSGGQEAGERWARRDETRRDETGTSVKLDDGHCDGIKKLLSRR